MFARRAKRSLDETDRPVVGRVVPGWAHLGTDQQDRLFDLTDRLLRRFRWEAANGFDLSDMMCVHIAAQASLLIVELDESAYAKVGTVVVRPSSVRRTRVSEGPVAGVVEESSMYLAGEAADGDGPVVLAWDSVVADTRHVGRSHNVVIHEFAHKIDLLDNMFDGTPPILENDRRELWIRVFTEAFERLRGGVMPSGLRDYAATNPVEFFAVATETFFTSPVDLRNSEGDVYQLLANFYRQDPARRIDL